MGNSSVIRTGRKLNAAGSAAKPRAPSALLGKDQQFPISPTFDVNNIPAIVRLYNAIPGDLVEVQSVAGTGAAEFVSELVWEGVPVVLTSNHNEQVLDRSGRYRVVLKNGDLTRLAVFMTYNEVSP